MDLELSHDIHCRRAAYDNRRQPPSAVLIAYGQLLMDSELSHDILCTSRSDDNRRADGGHLDLQQYIISYLLKIISNKADVCEAFCLFCVICGS